MGAEHKPPLYAFLVVAIVGALVMFYAARSEAFRHEVLQRTVVVAGSVLDQAAGDPAPTAVDVPAPVTATPAEDAADRQRRDGHGQPGRAGRDHRGPEAGHGHGPGQAPGLATAPGQAKGKDPGKDKGKGNSEAAGMGQVGAQGASRGPARGPGTGHGQGKGPRG